MKTVVPTVIVERGQVPSWAHRVVHQAVLKLQQTDCVLAVRWRYSRIRGNVPSEWAMVALFVDGLVAASVSALPAQGFVSSSLKRPGLTAGRHTFSIELSGGDTFVSPVTVDVPFGSVIIVDVTPQDYQGKSGRDAVVSIHLLTSGFSLNGRWGRCMARRLGWPVSGNDLAGAGR